MVVIHKYEGYCTNRMRVEFLFFVHKTLTSAILLDDRDLFNRATEPETEN